MNESIRSSIKQDPTPRLSTHGERVTHRALLNWFHPPNGAHRENHGVEPVPPITSAVPSINALRRRLPEISVARDDFDASRHARSVLFVHGRVNYAAFAAIGSPSAANPRCAKLRV